MIRRIMLAALLAFAFPTLPVVAASGHHPTSVNGQVAMFSTEGAAQAHCPADTVVWLNTKSGIYHEKGMRWYGRTKHGAYVCRKEAEAAGDRDTKNGQ